MALGAGAADVVRLVLSQGMRPALVGIVLGLGGAYLASTALRSMLYNVKALDVTTLVTVAGLLFVVTIVATLVPACRASRISPITTLRME
jgi:putative ABC transport system permease protein